MKYFASMIVGGLVLLSNFSPVRADFIIPHEGQTDPITEGFTLRSIGSSSTLAVPNDIGLPAWRVTGSAENAQLIYASGALNSAQDAVIASQGFVLTAVARVTRNNNLAPAYSTTNPVIIGGMLLDTGTRRFEMSLGINSSGDTVVVLPTSIDAGGPGNSLRTPGASFTLTGSGSSYHTYKLVYDPVTKLADLFVDGVPRLEGYAGNTSFVGDHGLVWYTGSGGEADFNLVEVAPDLTVAPEPSSGILMASAGIGIALATIRKRWPRRNLGVQ
jgi:hypothetical protein